MEIPIRRGVSCTRKSDAMQMHFILTMHVKVEVVNIITYIASFISIKMSLKSYPLTAIILTQTWL